MDLENENWLIKGGILIGCNDISDDLIIPEGVEKISEDISWPQKKYKTVTFPLSLQEAFINNLECDEIICQKPYDVSENFLREAKNPNDPKYKIHNTLKRDIRITIKSPVNFKPLERIIFTKSIAQEEMLASLASDSILTHIIIESKVPDTFFSQIKMTNLKKTNINIHSYEKKEYLITDGVLLKYYGSSSDIVIPENVHTIATNAFAYEKITSITFPRGLKKIGNYAFWRCDFSKVPLVFLPDSVKYLGSCAFCARDGGQNDINNLSMSPNIIFKINPPFTIGKLTLRCSNKQSKLLEFLERNDNNPFGVGDKIKQLNISGFCLNGEVTEKIRKAGYISSIAQVSETDELVKYYFVPSTLTQNIPGPKEEIVIGREAIDYQCLLPSLLKNVQYLYYDNTDGLGLLKFINYIYNNGKYSIFKKLQKIFIIGEVVPLWQKMVLKRLIGQKKLTFEEIPSFEERSLKNFAEERQNNNQDDEKTLEDEEANSLINKIRELISGFLPEDQSLVLDKVNAIIDKYNSDLDNLSLGSNYGDEIVLHENCQSPNFLRAGLLASLESIIAIMTMNKACQKLKEDISKYEGTLQDRQINIPPSVNNYDDKINFIIASSFITGDNSFIKELQRIFAQIKEEISHKSIKYLIDEIKVETGDIYASFYLQIDSLYEKTKKAYETYRLFEDASFSPLASHLKTINDYINMFDENSKKLFSEEFRNIVQIYYEQFVNGEINDKEAIYMISVALDPFLNILAATQSTSIKYKDILNDINYALAGDYALGSLICEEVKQINDLIQSDFLSKKKREEIWTLTLDALQSWKDNIQNPDFVFPSKVDYFNSPPKIELSNMATRFLCSILCHLYGIRLYGESIFLSQKEICKLKLKKVK